MQGIHTITILIGNNNVKSAISKSFYYIKKCIIECILKKLKASGIYETVLYQWQNLCREWNIFTFMILLHKVLKNNGLLKIRHMTTDVSISSKMQ